MNPLRVLTRAARDLPAPVRGGLRTAAWGWGRATARWRQLPDLIVVGAQRSGTTTLFRMMAEHPHLMRPTLVKGTGYFDDGYLRGRGWYAAHFPLRLTAAWKGRGRAVRVFECSGYYLFHPLAAQRIAADLPGVDVVVLLRDPVERAHSAHRHEQARGFESLDFGAALDAEPRRLAGEALRLAAQPGSTSFEHRHHGYQGRSAYAEQVQRLVDVLGADRVHLVEAERLFADPVGEFARLQARLGLPLHRTSVLQAWNARPGPGLDPATTARLRATFEEDDHRLAGLLGHTPAWREDI